MSGGGLLWPTDERQLMQVRTEGVTRRQGGLLSSETHATNRAYPFQINNPQKKWFDFGEQIMTPLFLAKKSDPQKGEKYPQNTKLLRGDVYMKSLLTVEFEGGKMTSET